jgi:hypothetical protein
MPVAAVVCALLAPLRGAVVGVVVVALGATLVVAPSAAADAAGKKCAPAQARYVWLDRADRVPRNHGPVGRYYADAGLWAAKGSDYRSRMVVCGPGNWKVRVRVHDEGRGSVKAYPNVHLDFIDWRTGYEPRLSEFRRLRAVFAARSPDVGVYNVAFDIWFNGIGRGARELMIWTENRGQTPAGEPVGRMRFANRDWTIWQATLNGIDYLALVPQRDLRRGGLPLLSIITRLIRRDLLPADSTLAQIGFGVEVVSTRGAAATFRFDRFRVIAERR